MPTMLKTALPDPHPANRKNPPLDLLSALASLDNEQLARLIEFTLQTRRHRLGLAEKEELIEEIAWWQRVDTQMQIHLGELAVAVYDARHPKHWLWKSHKQFFLDRLEPGTRVLDVGCGASAYLLWMAELGCDVTACDIDAGRIEQARSIMSHERLRFEVRDATKWIPSEPFDTVICSHVIEHLEEPVQMLSALRACAPRLLVAVPPMDNRWQKVMFKDLALRWKDDEDHVREYTPLLLSEQIERAGWRLTEMIPGVDIKAVAIRD